MVVVVVGVVVVVVVAGAIVMLLMFVVDDVDVVVIGDDCNCCVVLHVKPWDYVGQEHVGHGSITCVRRGGKGNSKCTLKKSNTIGQPAAARLFSISH